ncbi:hypothetical protein OGAPHI_004993 [Ogataea philodendri]|uniref:Uncharacterized protein n=1 Tax=Ogataea philodendri TaxID=1378263 RepID=A0A9P8P1S9_9ASCO|nr:uncharacterized protein OGAPHI_004993 [Ogataea philodendri]KAH3663592.1 hypothetical protein OGAPHI_004993 [Ogataea philodendri]
MLPPNSWNSLPTLGSISGGDRVHAATRSGTRSVRYSCSAEVLKLVEKSRLVVLYLGTELEETFVAGLGSDEVDLLNTVFSLTTVLVNDFSWLAAVKVELTCDLSSWISEAFSLSKSDENSESTVLSSPTSFDLISARTVSSSLDPVGLSKAMSNWKSSISVSYASSGMLRTPLVPSLLSLENPSCTWRSKIEKILPFLWQTSTSPSSFFKEVTETVGSEPTETPTRRFLHHCVAHSIQFLSTQCQLLGF